MPDVSFETGRYQLLSPKIDLNNIPIKKTLTTLISYIYIILKCDDHIHFLATKLGSHLWILNIQNAICQLRYCKSHIVVWLTLISTMRALLAIISSISCKNELFAQSRADIVYIHRHFLSRWGYSHWMLKLYMFKLYYSYLHSELPPYSNSFNMKN